MSKPNNKNKRESIRLSNLSIAMAIFLPGCFSAAFELRFPVGALELNSAWGRVMPFSSSRWAVSNISRARMSPPVFGENSLRAESQGEIHLLPAGRSCNIRAPSEYRDSNER